MAHHCLKELLALQAVDMRIRHLEQRVALIPKEIESHRQEQEKLRAAMKAKKEELNRVGLDIKKVEGDIKQKQDDILKIQSRSTMVKKNDEYQAMLKEIDGIKAKISDLETREIELLDVSAEAEASWKDFEKQSNSSIKSLDGEIGELQELVGQLKEEITRTKDGRHSMLNKIDTETLNRYQRLLASKQGEPVVKVENSNCGHCHLKLIPQTLLKVSGGLLPPCDNCSHLLYSAEE